MLFVCDGKGPPNNRCALRVAPALPCDIAAPFQILPSSRGHRDPLSRNVTYALARYVMVLLKHKDLVDPSSCPLHSYENIKRENASCSAKASSATVDKELPRRQVRAKRLPHTVTRVLNLWPVRLGA